jgi:probable rRNA maturation factor
MAAIEIEVANRQKHLQLREARLRRLVRHVLGAEGFERACISLAIVDDATIQELHRRFLHVDDPTDVMSFPLGDDPLEGEVVVNAQQAVQVAARLGGAPEQELFLYVVHGLLHLCGYDDRDDRGAAAMRTRQTALLAECGMFPAVEPPRSRDEGMIAPWSGEE